MATKKKAAVKKAAVKKTATKKTAVKKPGINGTNGTLKPQKSVDPPMPLQAWENGIEIEGATNE